MAKPNFTINVAHIVNSSVTSFPLGAAWETQKGNHRIQLTSYSIQPDELVYLLPGSSAEPDKEIEHALVNHYSRVQRGNSINAMTKYRVFSAKQIKDGRVWFQTHGEIVLAQSDESDLLLMRLTTLPYPHKTIGLFFSPADKKHPANEENNAPFCESIDGIDENDYV